MPRTTKTSGATGKPAPVPSKPFARPQEAVVSEKGFERGLEALGQRQDRDKPTIGGNTRDMFSASPDVHLSRDRKAVRASRAAIDRSKKTLADADERIEKAAERMTMTDAEQGAEFEQPARKRGCDDDDEKFRGVLQKRAKPKS